MADGAGGRRPAYRSPEDVLTDNALSREAKIDLLEQWKLTLNRPIDNDPMPEETRKRAAEIDAAIGALRRGGR